MSKSLVVSSLTLLVFAFVATGTARADYLIDGSGYLIKVDGSVLGDDDQVEVENEDAEDIREVPNQAIPRGTNPGNIQRTENSVAETNREMEKRNAEKIREAAKQKLERQIEANKRKSPSKNEFELETDGDKLKIKQKIELRNGTHQETEVELEPKESLHVDQSDGERLEINAVKNGELEIRREKLKAKTELPLTVNNNNELVVTRPDGTTKIVTVLPDQAVEKMIEKGLLDDVAEVENSDDIQLTENKAGEPVYQIKHEETKRFLGLFRARFQKQTEVSAETGVTVTTSTESSPFRKFLERFSF